MSQRKTAQGNECPAWQWNEMQQVGTDYSSTVEVERYERRMGEFRNLAAEDAAMLDALALSKGAHILEIGTGSGHFARAAAGAGFRVTALDVSPAMLKYAEERARTDGLTGIEFQHAGFLTFKAAPGAFDAAVSALALHHLPDVWKMAALNNIHRVLKPDGLFLLRDVVFSSKDHNLSGQFDAFINGMPEAVRPGAIGHVSKEFSTLDWIMEGLLERAGFRICSVEKSQAPLVQYLCRAGKP